jgi:branched-chain amino acid transport system ATP-binding protein
MGLSRSFQITSLFHRLSVFENVRCALLWSRGYGYSIAHLLNKQRDLNTATAVLLERLGLWDRRDSKVLRRRRGNSSDKENGNRIDQS